MTDEEVLSVTPKEYRAMLDRLGFFTRPTEDGFDIFDARTNRQFQVCRARNGWWDVRHMDGTRLWMSQLASEATEAFFIESLPNYR